MTALTQMAAARPPGIADARVPCPLCGGLIHPVAGRCKHCKEDLTALRSARPHAAAALPALNGANTANGYGHHAHAAATAVPVAPAAREASHPILPPRTTSRSVPVQRAHSIWRSWPMLVIVVAVIAIVGATVIMVMPQDDEKKGGTISTPPAPERMQTNPLPEKQGSIDSDKPDPIDPWSQPGTVPQVPGPPAPVDPDDDDDVWGGIVGGTGPSAGGLGIAGGLGTGSFMVTVLDRACTKLKSCPSVDPSSLRSICEAVAMMPKPPSQTSCVAAKKCLQAIDELDCSDAGSASPHSVFTMFNDCTLAATQC